MVCVWGSAWHKKKKKTAHSRQIAGRAPLITPLHLPSSHPSNACLNALHAQMPSVVCLFPVCLFSRSPVLQVTRPARLPAWSGRPVTSSSQITSSKVKCSKVRVLFQSCIMGRDFHPNPESCRGEICFLFQKVLLCAQMLMEFFFKRENRREEREMVRERRERERESLMIFLPSPTAYFHIINHHQSHHHHQHTHTHPHYPSICLHPYPLSPSTHHYPYPSVFHHHVCRQNCLPSFLFLPPSTHAIIRESQTRHQLDVFCHTGMPVPNTHTTHHCLPITAEGRKE